jgi:hypothetical protein
MTAGQLLRLIATVSGTSNTAITWRIKSGPGSIATNGTYSAPKSITVATTVVVEAISVADSTQSATAVISLQPGISVVVTPAFFDVRPNERQILKVQVLGTSDQRVTYSLSLPLGSISTAGVYTPPSVVTQQTWIEITVRSVADPTRTARVLGLLQP